MISCVMHTHSRISCPPSASCLLCPSPFVAAVRRPAHSTVGHTPLRPPSLRCVATTHGVHTHSVATHLKLGGQKHLHILCGSSAPFPIPRRISLHPLPQICCTARVSASSQQRGHRSASPVQPHAQDQSSSRPCLSPAPRSLCAAAPLDTRAHTCQSGRTQPISDSNSTPSATSEPFATQMVPEGRSVGCRGQRSNRACGRVICSSLAHDLE